jgi:hypothetical protein
VALLGTLFNARVSAAAPGLPLEATLHPGTGLPAADAARLAGAVAHGLEGVMAVLALTCCLSLLVAWSFPAGARGDEVAAPDVAGGH